MKIPEPKTAIDLKQSQSGPKCPTLLRARNKIMKFQMEMNPKGQLMILKIKLGWSNQTQLLSRRKHFFKINNMMSALAKLKTFQTKQGKKSNKWKLIVREYYKNKKLLNRHKGYNQKTKKDNKKKLKKLSRTDCKLKQWQGSNREFSKNRLRGKQLRQQNGKESEFSRSKKLTGLCYNNKRLKGKESWLSKLDCKLKDNNKNKLQLKRQGKKLRRLKLLDRKLSQKNKPGLQLKMHNVRHKRQKLLD